MAKLVPADVREADRPAETERSVRKLARGLDVESVRKSNLVRVGYRASDPAQAARVLTALSTVYVQKHMELQRPSGELSFFQQQTDEYGNRLRHSEDQLAQFTRTQGVVSAAAERDIALQKLGEAEANCRQIIQNRAENERRMAALHEQIAKFPQRSVTLVRSADNPELQEKMKTRLLELQLKRTELLTRFQS
jgi:uncharacterized protein involved in exopolysaccharide biosynthesis